MKNSCLHHFVYADSLIGVTTNDRNFKWIYGTKAPFASKKHVEKCLVQLQVMIVPDEKVEMANNITDSFQNFFWNSSEKTMYYNRRLMGKKFTYSISVSGNKIKAVFGKRYYRLIRYRIMNLHSPYYILSDLVNSILVRNGYISLYASAVYDTKLNEGTAFFGPPNTGKTITMEQLCHDKRYVSISEDVVITNSDLMYSCPWTNTYRKKSSGFFDSSGSIVRKKKNPYGDLGAFGVSNLVLLSKTKTGSKVVPANERTKKKISILNGYIFNYYSSPVIKVLSYFSDEFNYPYQEKYDEILKMLFSSCEMKEILCNNPIEYAEKFKEL